jgi:SpoVK/Ycf46/Vps4 family AAA+-type ATPase
MFLHGAPGNGKTSIAERISRCFGSYIWIPRTLLIDGVCVRFFDPVLHEQVAGEDESMLGEPLEDARWVRIRRPTVVVGGELTMDQLEMRHDTLSNVSEAPLQMKSNCGVLLVDDFGRQAMPVDQLLNRWIVPLEKRYDFQKLPTGKKIQVPFDQLVVFSTNLAPRDLVDEAFLRRLPYKIEAHDPSPQQFCKIAMHVAPSLGVQVTQIQILTMIEKHFLATGRPMRCCHPRDLLLQVRSFCRFYRRPLEMSDEAMKFAVENYFTVM